ncbi:MAG: ADP-ribosylglycohydrolase family protein [Hahellaceae bacterium]|nr:ADP-ribosylglycohydrolase family protein [Hahellaceae bacterium]MCP5168291.1 ADP-ribosylglycohydrolase family protein [Hahellaceae bacterium]
MNSEKQISQKQRYLGCMLGLACGDAVGTTVEFRARGTFPEVTDMTGGGPFALKKGEWTDDTSMALCLAHSLLARKGFDAVDQMNRYCNWMNYGYMSCNGTCFDIGTTVQRALNQYQITGNPLAGSADPFSAGNGALMRLAPVPMYYLSSLGDTLLFSAESSRTTHAAPEAIDCAKLFGTQLRAALMGETKEKVLFDAGYAPDTDKVRTIAQGHYREKSDAEIVGSGYVVASLEAALWCFDTTDSYEACVLKAVNLGDDADTTAAIAGQLAGAYYGVEAIPGKWLESLAMKEEIIALAEALFVHRNGADAASAD